MSDLRTISPDELTELADAPEGLRAIVQSPSGPLQRIPIDRLISKLIAADLAKPTKAALDADLEVNQDSVALVFSDPTPSLNGWYRKLGASGAGSWTQFEELSRNTRVAAETAAVAAGEAAIEAGRFEVPLVESQAVGNATIPNNKAFRVAKGTTPETFDWYQRDLVGPGSRLVDPPATFGAFAVEDGAQRVVTDDGRTVQARIDELAVGSVGYAPSGDVTGETDTAAFRALVLAKKTIRLQNYDGTNAYYISGDVTALVPEDAPGKQYAASVIGDPGVTEDAMPRIIVTKPGVTPFPASWRGALVGVAVEYGQKGITPAVSGHTYPYARAIAATGTISTVSGKLRLTVPAGGLIGADADHPNVTRGSAVVMLNDPAKHQDYWVNNYVDDDSVFQIDEVLSDTVCTLQGKDGTAYTGPVHIRGNAAATVWTQYQPTGFRMYNCGFGAVPGCAFMTMGTQFIEIVGNNGLIALSAPHLRMIYAGNGQGLLVDNGQGQGWGNGGTYHQCRVQDNRGFYSTGGFAINGLIDSKISNLQCDPNALTTTFPGYAAIAEYMTPPNYIHSFAGLINIKPKNISCEDTPANGIGLFQCFLTTLENPHTFDLGPDAWPVTIESGGNNRVETPRLDPGSYGDPQKQIRYLGLGSDTVSEVALDLGGRHGRKNAVRQQGTFGKLVSVLDERDRTRYRLILPAATLEASSSSEYFVELPSAVFDDFNGFDHFRLEDISFEHGGSWTGSFGGPPGSAAPDIACGTAADHDAVFAELPLNVAAGYYRKLSRITGFSPVDFCAGQLGANTNLRFTIRSGDGGPFNNGTFNAFDLKIWVTISGARA